MVGQLNGITNIDLAVPRSFPEMSGTMPADLAAALCTYTTLTLRRDMEIFLISPPYTYRFIDTNL